MILQPQCPICHKGKIVVVQRVSQMVTMPIGTDGNALPHIIESEYLTPSKEKIICDTCLREIPKKRALRAIARHLGKIENQEELQKREKAYI